MIDGQNKRFFPFFFSVTRWFECLAFFGFFFPLLKFILIELAALFILYGRRLVVSLHFFLKKISFSFFIKRLIFGIVISGLELETL